MKSSQIVFTHVLTSKLFTLIIFASVITEFFNPSRAAARNTLQLEMQGSHFKPPVHLDLEARASEYSQYFGGVAVSPQLNSIIAVGERNLAWLKHINSMRKDKLSFSSKATVRGIPIEAAQAYNAELIQKSFDELVATLPKEMSDVLLHQAPMTDAPPIATADYLKFGRLVDRAYQYAIRWGAMQVYLPALAAIAVDDVRGYYFLKKEDQLHAEFEKWSSLDPVKRTQLSEWLTQICANVVRDRATCESKVSLLKSAKDLQAFYDQYFLLAEHHYNDYFTLAVPRNDVKWLKATNEMSVPFQDPQKTEISDFLKLNIEDEWKWLGWQLHLNIIPVAETHIEFRPGSLPHVNQVGGSIITMDENAPLSEYDVQWTIRHEYGHTLGFVDCYLEFYDVHLAAIVNYQLDTSNLMCSRQGHLKEVHFSELEKNYSK